MLIDERTAARFWSKVERTDSCWLWRGHRNPRGYGQLVVSKKVARGRKIPAHRVAWMIAHGEIPSGLFVCHRCDNPPCVRADHLFLGTNAENLDDMTRKGRRPVGVRHYESKLTEAQVRALRSRPADVPLSDMARAFGVTLTAAHRAATGQTYRSVI